MKKLTRQEENKILAHFLKENNCLKSFIVNRMKINKQTFMDESVSLRNAISNAFWWSPTLEGHLFWVDIHVLWINYLSNSKIL